MVGVVSRQLRHRPVYHLPRIALGLIRLADGKVPDGAFCFFGTRAASRDLVGDRRAPLDRALVGFPGALAQSRRSRSYCGRAWNVAGLGDGCSATKGLLWVEAAKCVFRAAIMCGCCMRTDAFGWFLI